MHSVIYNHRYNHYHKHKHGNIYNFLVLTILIDLQSSTDIQTLIIDNDINFSFQILMVYVRMQAAFTRTLSCPLDRGSPAAIKEAHC